MNQDERESYTDRLITPSMQIQTASNDDYLILELIRVDTYLTTAGHPRLPIIVLYR